jgi:hypothetical protein
LVSGPQVVLGDLWAFDFPAFPLESWPPSAASSYPPKWRAHPTNHEAKAEVFFSVSVEFFHFFSSDLKLAIRPSSSGLTRRLQADSENDLGGITQQLCNGPNYVSAFRGLGSWQGADCPE